jgi:hypothetical protein
MICAELDHGYFQPVITQPADVSACTYVIQSGAEQTSNPFLMTKTEAMQIGFAISSLWVTVAVLRFVSRRFF